jgi:hypothetical protein
MAVAATHTALVHFALDKRAVDIDLVLNLAVWMIQPFPQYLWLIMIEKLCA